MTQRTRREFLEDSLLAAAATLAGSTVASPRAAMPRRRGGDVIRVAVIGVRGRGRGHVKAYKQSPNAEVVAICDCDEGVIERAMKAVPTAKYYKDIRELLQDDGIDAVSIAMPNHWHSLASIWAMQAGKDVFVEKPVSHNVIEGRRVVEAARKYGRIVQHGTQARSMTATRDAMAWLQDGGLGEVRVARALCYKRRESIGKVDGPQTPPATLDYNLWIGPAAMEPLHRKSLHYDWHWDFNTGNGDIGNQGVHQMDIARWGLGQEGLPTRVVSCGGRLGYEDDANTPNTQIAVYDYGAQQVIFEVRGLPTEGYRNTHIGVVFHCERGYLVSASYGKVVAFDLDGKPIKMFEGAGDHIGNFLDAVRARDPKLLNADIEGGHISSAMCHLGNVSYRLGTPQRLDAVESPFAANEAAADSFLRFREHLEQQGLKPDATDYRMGPTLQINPSDERCHGPMAAVANELCTRPARQPFAVPEEV
ncbi:MAG: Gfo/Idh/MocA family oxidoreductase [Planctomycetota bacterium]